VIISGRSNFQLFKTGFILLMLLGYFLSAYLFSSVITFQADSPISSFLYEMAIFCQNSNTQWMVLTCMAAWSSVFILLTFNLNDLALMGVLLVAIYTYFIEYAAYWHGMDASIFFAGIMMGKGAGFFFKNGEGKMDSGIFLTGLAGLLAFLSWWHVDMINSYHGPRWMGLWDDPNTYGMMMGAGTTLAMALQISRRKSKIHNPRSSKARTIFWSMAIFMMVVGLVMSYSRGAWLGTAIALSYLTWCHGQLKWRYVVLGIGLAVLGVLLFWGRTPDSSPWYIRRIDLGRPSAQHRTAAWRAGLQIMRDHPFGVGWNKAIETYQKNYLPPESNASAITTNDYLMLGTQLGIPALICFFTYILLCLRNPRPKTQNLNLENCAAWDIGHQTLDAIQIACRSAALVFLVAFWFDDGLFKLPTAAFFWVLLELGSSRYSKRMSPALSA
jgi:hypothetical protein